MYKKVSGERFVAAMIDSIIVSIAASVPVVIYLLAEGFESFVNYYIDGGGMYQGEDWYLTFMLIAVVVETVIGVLYFVYMPYKMNGQTLGKKIMKIKAIDLFGNNPSFKQHFIRAIQNWSVYATALTFFIIYIDVMVFSVVTGAVSSIIGLIAFVSYIMILAKEDGRGLHDTWTDTRVVREDIDLNKEFVEKTTQMGEWATVVGEEGKAEDEDDPWKI
jgi:uncharacterized RDD family membrane protein YckC